ncbi:hypothetical protein F5Y10DRAFT_246048 [Nemania abortiva]|nr:hypothetical protein F5Y10DRAFT_246048 [Nemania abortiva]
MDAEPQDAPPPRNRADADAVVMGPRRRRSNDSSKPLLDHPSPAAVATAATGQRPDPCAATGANQRDSAMKDAAKEPEGSDSETKASKEPPSPQAWSPLKRRPTSTRQSAETYRSLGVDDDIDRKSKQSSFSIGDNSSIYTLDSNDERRLSDKVKKAWRGVTGQKYMDPLEEWMVKHSGGTLRDVGASRSPKKSSDKR